mmetsp:Transcript_1831/g.3271  ORF Transcript_1831/g.3271 Transcript_1831/m.3271 type:complete len:124 (-) Transcript_1831:869-1240(-)
MDSISASLVKRTAQSPALDLVLQANRVQMSHFVPTNLGEKEAPVWLAQLCDRTLLSAVKYLTSSLNRGNKIAGVVALRSVHPMTPAPTDFFATSDLVKLGIAWVVNGWVVVPVDAIAVCSMTR